VTITLNSCILRSNVRVDFVVGNICDFMGLCVGSVPILITVVSHSTFSIKALDCVALERRMLYAYEAIEAPLFHFVIFGKSLFCQCNFHGPKNMKVGKCEVLAVSWMGKYLKPKLCMCGQTCRKMIPCVSYLQCLDHIADFGVLQNTSQFLASVTASPCLN
jgi:hypothetical protein